MKAKNAKTTKQITEINWDVSKEESDIIGQIAKRASFAADKIGVNYKYMDAIMDLTACHANGTPLRLAELLKADDGNFGHDVFGIRRHIDRETGKLGDCFLPRYARPS